MPQFLPFNQLSETVLGQNECLLFSVSEVASEWLVTVSKSNWKIKTELSYYILSYYYYYIIIRTEHWMRSVSNPEPSGGTMQDFRFSRLPDVNSAQNRLHWTGRQAQKQNKASGSLSKLHCDGLYFTATLTTTMIHISFKGDHKLSKHVKLITI